MDQPAHLALGILAQPQEGLAQLDAVPLGQPVQPFDAAIQEMAVAGVRHRLGLDRGVDGDPLEVLALHRIALQRRGDAFRQHRLDLVRPDALAPARH